MSILSLIYESTLHFRLTSTELGQFKPMMGHILLKWSSNDDNKIILNVRSNMHYLYKRSLLRETMGVNATEDLSTA